MGLNRTLRSLLGVLRHPYDTTVFWLPLFWTRLLSIENTHTVLRCNRLKTPIKDTNPTAGISYATKRRIERIQMCVYMCVCLCVCVCLCLSVCVC